MAPGLLSSALESGLALEVKMNEVQFLVFRQNSVSCIGTGNLGGCSVVKIVSPLAAIIAHISPHPDSDWANPEAADQHVQEKMEEVTNLFRHCERYFPPERTTWVLSATLDGDVVLPGQRDIMERSLRRLGLLPSRLIYTVLRPQDPRFPGQGTVFIDGRGSIPLVYVEDRPVSTGVQSIVESRSRHSEQSSHIPESSALQNAAFSQTSQQPAARHVGDTVQSTSRRVETSTSTSIPVASQPQSQSTSRHTSAQITTGSGLASQPVNLPSSAPRLIRAQRHSHQGKTGMLVESDGKRLFIADEHWQKARVQGKDAMYCRSQNIYAII